jgi:hypothetical protein
MKIQKFARSSGLLLALLATSACAGNHKKATASTSAVFTESRQLTAMSDEEASSQKPGQVRKSRQASQEVIANRGKIKKQETETTELVETDITTVIETTTAVTSDQDMQ